MSDLRIATRRSPLAMIQAGEVRSALIEAHPGIEVSLVEVSTTGDEDRISPVSTLTEVGAFVRAVQQAVLDGEADVAVHSCKDLPVSGPDELTVFYLPRREPWDVLCGHDLESLPDGGRVGTGSPRRAAQIRRIRSDVDIVEIRGNVGTRIEKMRSGECDALILAEVGLRRLGLEGEIRHRFSIDEMVPAPAQAALAVETIKDSPAVPIIARLDDPVTRMGVEAERELLSATGAGCRAALGALGEPNGAGVQLTAFVEDEAGPRDARVAGSSPTDTARKMKTALGL